MRINKYIALCSGISRRAADDAIAHNQVTIDGQPATAGMLVADNTVVALDGEILQRPQLSQTIMLNKPAGYVTSRSGQGSQTIYDLLPEALHRLKPVGRLDKNSSGLLLLTNDGILANQLTHPRYGKTKEYIITLDKMLTPKHREQITKTGVSLDDGLSRFTLDVLDKDRWRVTMREGRNRQIRRTFEALGYSVVVLHRTTFGAYLLGSLQPGKWHKV